MDTTAVAVRPVQAADADQWAALYRDYRSFYRLTPDDEVVARVWSWVLDPAHEVNSLVAVSTTTPAGGSAPAGGQLVGLANHRRFARPSSGTVGLYLDDLFTSPAARGAGIGQALLTELAQLAARDGLSVVRWITAADNDRARRLYDHAATLTQWVTYDLVPTGRRSG